jgi:hypothetical protein
VGFGISSTAAQKLDGTKKPAYATKGEDSFITNATGKNS